MAASFPPTPCAIFAVLAAAAFPVAAVAAERISFNRDVRPILSDNCFHCHGPGEKDRKGGLRLDVRDAALKGGESGPAFIAGKPGESELIARILTADADDHMPPRKSGKSLKPAQIETLRQWVAQGAEYQGHWAFLKPERPPVPPISALRLANAGWSANPIDAFILKRLADAGLKPSPAASPETLIRRMTLDLTGIPPTPEEVAEFTQSAIANRQSPIEALADRLLASPRYGEKMAQQWLDFARFADSNGFQSDTSRQMWPWRDWVIGAFNRNEPFDQFTIDQLAGDLQPGATREQIVATGFNRNHRLNGEGGRIVEEWFAETVIDRVETTGLTWLALTLNCCRCHDHKYDPISQREFYQLFAFFNSNDELGVLDEFGGAGRTRAGGNSRPFIRLPDAAQEAQLAQLNAAVGGAEAMLAQVRRTAPQRLAAWEPESRRLLAEDAAGWAVLSPTRVESEGGATFTRLEDGTWLAGGKNPAHDVYAITAPIEPGNVSGVLLETFPDASLPTQSLGRNGNGNYVLTDVDVEILPPDAAAIPLPLTHAAADYSQKGWDVQAIVAEKPKRKRGEKNRKGWAIDGPTRREPRKAMFLAAAPVNAPAGAQIRVTLRHDALANHNIGRLRISATGRPPALVSLEGAKISPALRAALSAEAAQRTAGQRAEVEKFFRENADTALKDAEAKVSAAKKAAEEFEGALASAMVMKEKPEPRDAFILKRGEYDKPGDKVARGLPAALPPLPAGAPMNRLGFAQWLVSGEHPLTARVWVNRAWEKFFGTGLVKTTENFGSQADWPSHPELLDWLATEFVRIGWDMKAMCKLIVTSATYAQSSQVTPEHLAKDPENRLLARGPRFRLPAETLRDQALAISGLLVERIGGPSVRPYMPAAVWDETSVYGDMRNYKADTGDGLYRRTLYTVWKRTAAPPTMQLFDAPTREICTVKRSRTNTPLQALALLNEVTYVEAARVLAQRMLSEGGATPEQRIAWGFHRATGREPLAAELKVLAGGLAKRLARYERAPEEAQKLLAIGEARPDPQRPAAEIAAYTTTANVLLNLDEVVTRE